MIQPESNLEFYRKMELSKFRYFAEIIGMDSCQDLKTLDSYLQKAQNILELGAGYGRALEWLTAHSQANIQAVERADSLVTHLQHSFGDRVAISQSDIRDFVPPQQFDVILWLWSGILELTEGDQKGCIEHYYRYVAPGGFMVIETPYKSIHKVGTLEDPKHIKVETDWGVLHAYFIDQQEITQYALEAGFSDVQTIVYQTGKGISRVIYLLLS